MKKKSLKSLRLNKQCIASINHQNILKGQGETDATNFFTILFCGGTYGDCFENGTVSATIDPTQTCINNCHQQQNL